MKKIRVMSVILALCLVFSVLTGCGGKTSGSAKASATIILIDKDEQEYTYNIEFTDGSSLRTALYEGGLISEEQFGAYFIEDIDGHIADVENDGCTWLPLDSEKNSITGKSFDDITVNNGDTYYLQYYVVPDYD